MLGYRHEEDQSKEDLWKQKKSLQLLWAGSLILGGSVTFAKDQEGVNAGVMVKWRTTLRRTSKKNRRKKV